MSQFDDETLLLRQSDHRFTAVPHASWSIGSKLNGGYLMALAASALRQLSPQHPDPLSMTVHYLKPGTGGQACEVDAQLLRQGKTVSTGRASLSQNGQPCLEALAMFGDLGAGQGAGQGAGDGASHVASDHANKVDSDTASADTLGGAHNGPPALAIPPPDMPPPEQCLSRSGQAQGVFLPIVDRLDIRLHPDDVRPGAGRAQMRGWIRFRDGREPDGLALLLMADAFPPSVFGVLRQVGWVPTLEMTVHVRRRPVAGWIQAQFNTRDLEGGRLIEDGVLWDASGALVAQVRQLALLPKVR